MDSGIVNFVQNELVNKKSLEEIRRAGADKGWSEKMINQAIDDLASSRRRSLESDEPKSVLEKPISDYTIPIAFLLFGLLILGPLTVISIWQRGWTPTGKEWLNLLGDPMGLMIIYFWLKSVVVDLIRIRKKQAVSMPGEVFWVYGLMFFIVWMVNNWFSGQGLSIDLAARDAKQIENLFWLRYKWWIFLILDSGASMVIYRLKRGWAKAAENRLFEEQLIIDVFKMMVLMALAAFLWGGILLSSFKAQW